MFNLQKGKGKVFVSEGYILFFIFYSLILKAYSLLGIKNKS